MLSLYYGGSEVPGHRTLLEEAGVGHVALSYVGLSRRTKFTRPWLMTDKYPDHQKILLDSGAYTYNKDFTAQTDEDVMAMAEKYYAFAAQNESRLEIVGEFDALQLGPDWIANMRDLYAPRFGDKFMPIWHAADGVSELEGLAGRYKRIAVTQTVIGERDLSPILNGLVRRYETLLHGHAMTKPDAMYDIPFTSVSSTSWLSPAQYGDTQVWVSSTLRRYPRPEKTKARARHYRLFEEAGFDAQAIVDDHPKEVLRLALWSWEQLVADINRRRPGEVVTASPNTDTSATTELTPSTVGMSIPETRNPPTPRTERRMLPFLARSARTRTVTDENGVRRTEEIQVLTTTGRSLVNCNSCYVKNVCDAFQPDAECVYEIPVSLRTKDEREAVNDTIEEILVERIMRGFAAEQVNGGYPDANVSAEVDRLARFRKLRNEAATSGFKVTVEASQRGEMGAISRIFGESAGEAARALEAPQSSQAMLADLHVIDAEVVEG